MLPYPVISDNDLAKIVHINDEGNLPGFASHMVDGRYDPAGGGEGLRARLADICAEVSAAIEAGARLIILSDRPRDDGQQLVPIPSLLLTGAVHHHLIKQKSRTRAGLVVEAGDVRECHHVALLVGYGAAAVNPYLAIESVRDLVRRGVIQNVSEFCPSPRIQATRKPCALANRAGSICSLRWITRNISRRAASSRRPYTRAAASGCSARNLTSRIRCARQNCTGTPKSPMYLRYAEK